MNFILFLGHYMYESLKMSNKRACKIVRYSRILCKTFQSVKSDLPNFSLFDRMGFKRIRILTCRLSIFLKKRVNLS